jgi:hypothetical protein
MRVAAEGLGNDLLQLCLDLVDVLAWSKAGPIADAKDMRVDRERLLAECRVQNDIGSLAANAGQRLQRFPRARHLAAVLLDQCLAEQDDVLRLGVEQSDRLDRIAQRILAEVDHLLWGAEVFE